MSNGSTEERVTPFVEWLEKHRKGEVDTELTVHLRQLIEAVQAVDPASLRPLWEQWSPAPPPDMTNAFVCKRGR